jgi:hypothetical protein
MSTEPIPLSDIITGVQTLHLEPGDVLVFLCPTVMRPAVAEWLRDQCARTFPGRTIMVLDQGITIARIAASPSGSGAPQDAGA